MIRRIIVILFSTVCYGCGTHEKDLKKDLNDEFSQAANNKIEIIGFYVDSSVLVYSKAIAMLKNNIGDTIRIRNLYQGQASNYFRKMNLKVFEITELRKTYHIGEQKFAKYKMQMEDKLAPMRIKIKELKALGFRFKLK